MANDQHSNPACRTLVLDAGPLLSLTPLRGLARRYVTVPHVLLELKDKDAREHFERLGLTAGVSVEIQEPDAASLLEVTQAARKTGDYSALSTADLRVLALTVLLDKQEKAEKALEGERGQIKLLPTSSSVASAVTQSPIIQEQAGENSVGNLAKAIQSTSLEGSRSDAGQDSDKVDGTRECEIAVRPPLEAEYIDQNSAKSPSDDAMPSPSVENNASQTKIVFEDPSDSEDGEGEWITPANVALHKSRALDLLPSSSVSDHFTTVMKKKGKKPRRQQDTFVEEDQKVQLGVGCMTADFAMQNVLLQMGLNLVGVEGKKIQRVKNWVLRCHACFKICKDNTRKFCPSCGNPTLLRTSVTISAPDASGNEPVLQVHLKKNFVYRTRGTIYSIPAPQPGTSKTGSGEGLILREDQSEYMRAKKRADGQREKQEKKMLRDTLKASADGNGVQLGKWSDPDWMPELLSIGAGGKGRKMADSRTGADGMPIVGHGRKNPNQSRRRV